MQDQGHQYHAIDFLVYAYLQCGRENDAERLIEEVRTLPKMKDMYGLGFDPQISALTSFSADYALELHHWKEAEVLPMTSATDSGDASITYVARAIAAAHLGDLPTARANLKSIQDLRATLVNEKKPQLFIDTVGEDDKVVSAWIEHAEGRNEEPINTLRKFAEKEQGTFAAGGGIPAQEMIGDILFDTGRPAEALAEYEAELKLSRTDSTRFTAQHMLPKCQISAAKRLIITNS
jgi:hypothetical protein